MNRTLSLLFLLAITSSCKLQYASFQETTRPKHNSGLRKTWKPTSVAKLEPKKFRIVEKKVVKPHRLVHARRTIPVLITPEAYVKKTYQFGPSIKDIDLSGEDEVNDAANMAPFVKKRKGKKFRQVSSNLFIAILFLVITGVFAYLNLLSIAILFALASIIFLILAIKQLWKRRGQNKKKKNRKKFFEDLFS